MHAAQGNMRSTRAARIVPLLITVLTARHEDITLFMMHPKSETSMNGTRDTISYMMPFTLTRFLFSPKYGGLVSRHLPETKSHTRAAGGATGFGTTGPEARRWSGQLPCLLLRLHHRRW